MYSILICDDDCNSVNYIEDCIKNLGYGSLVETKTFSAAEKLLFYLEEELDQALIFVLDIELQAYNGIDLAKEILQRYPHAQIIFMSGYDQYFVDVYQVEHIYFLPKPMKLSQLKAALDKAMMNLKDMEEHSLMVNNNKGVWRIPLEDIFYIEKRMRVINIFRSGEQEELSFYGKMDEVESMLTNDFVRCHHSYFVNLDKVVLIKGTQALLSNGVSIPVSQAKYKFTRETFLNYLIKKNEKGFMLK